MSKGSRQRPLKVSKEQMEENWNRIFGKNREIIKGEVGREKERDTNESSTQKESRPRVDKGTSGKQV